MAATIGLAPALQGIVDELRAGGVQADLDPAKVNLPGVWVSLASLAPELLSGDGTAMAYCYLIVPNAAYPDVVNMLDKLVAAVLDAGVDSQDDIVPASVAMPDKTTLPSLRLSVLATYTRTETP